MKKFDFNKKKSAASSYYSFKKAEERKISRLSKDNFYHSQGAVRVIMENGVRVGIDSNGEVIWSF